jgi:integrase
MRRSEQRAVAVTTGVWQVGRKTFIIRAQPKDPITGKKKNIRRVLENSSRPEALRARLELIRPPSTPPSPVPQPTQATVGTPPESVADFATWWIKRLSARGDVEVSTMRRYTLALDRLSARLLATPLTEVTPHMIEAWMIAASAEFSATTVNSWRAVLRTLFNDATKFRDVARNPVAATRPLRPRTDLTQTNSLSPLQVLALLKELDSEDPMLALAATIQIYAGLRWQEVTALHWEDYSEAERVLTIRRKVQDGKVVPSTKSGRVRVVGVPIELKEALACRLELSMARNVRGATLILPSLHGKPICASQISKALRAASTRAGIPQRITSHGLRRTSTDLLRLGGVSPLVAKALIGHADDRMHAHYSTLRSSDAREAGDMAAAVLSSVRQASQVGNPTS